MTKIDIEVDDRVGCLRLVEDGVGLCTTKSRNVARRIRDALDKDTLVGSRVRWDYTDQEAVVVAICGPTSLIVRYDNNALDVVGLAGDRAPITIVPHPKPEADTPVDDGMRWINQWQIRAILQCLRRVEGERATVPDPSADLIVALERMLLP